MKLTLVAGARPNFMKIAPIIHEIHKAQKAGKNIEYRLVHTGQHYDRGMSNNFFDQLNIPKPHVNLEAGGGSQAEQTAAIMVRFEQDQINNPSDLVLVVGDVNSTVACAISAKKLHTLVAHVEAGIRSGDWQMPEEINRLVTDSITNYFFTTSIYANENLKLSGIEKHRIFFVGNTMIDTLLHQMSKFKPPQFWHSQKLLEKNYMVMTMHRPSNVDNHEYLSTLLNIIETHTENIPIIFPVHPRTKNNLNKIKSRNSNIFLTDPLPYLEFNFLVKHAKGVITDSGGITEETTVMGVPCLTLRDTTERPETCLIGTNELVGSNPKNLIKALTKLFLGNWKKGRIPSLWDGHASQRIISHLIELIPN